MADSKCARCGAATDDSTSRCKDCGRVDVRVCRLIQLYGEDFSTAWRTCLNENMLDKGEFTRAAQGVYGQDLAKLMVEKIEQTIKYETYASFTGSGEFMDLHDLEEKCKNNPERLAGIKTKGKTMKCPSSGVTLYEFVTFTTESMQRLTAMQQICQTITQQSKIKAVKAIKPKAKGKAKAKANPEDGANDAGAGEDPLQEVGDKEKEILEQHVVKLAESVEISNLYTAEIKDEKNQIWATLLPPWVLTQCEAQALNLDNKKSEINVIIEQQKSPMSMNAMGAAMKTLMKDAKEVGRRAELQIKEAKKMAGVEVPRKAKNNEDGEVGTNKRAKKTR